MDTNTYAPYHQHFLIARLDLERWGHFDGRRLTFGQAGRLHLVFGANEAGKSTTRARTGSRTMPPSRSASISNSSQRSFGTPRNGQAVRVPARFTTQKCSQ